MWPLVAAGVGIYLAGNIIVYGLRAYRRMHAEDGGGEAAEESSREGSENVSNPRVAVLSRCIGLDIGSSFSKIAHLDSVACPLISVLENREGRRSVASAVCALSAEEGLQIGSLARASRYAKSSKTAASSIVMRLMAEVSAEVTIDGKTYSADALCSLLAREMLLTTNAKGIKDVPTIINVPNNFTDAARNRLLKAVRNAGTEAIAVVPDGIASVLGGLTVMGPKGHEILTPAGYGGEAVTVAVIDIGGRITQLSLINISHRDGEPSLHAADSDAGLVLKIDSHITLPIGGETFDECIAQWCNEQFSMAHSAVLRGSLLDDPLAKQRLFDAVEEARHDLSVSGSSHITIPFITATSGGPLHLSQLLSRAQLDKLLAPSVLDIQESFRKILFTGGATAPLRAILLVGGGSRMPFARRLVQEVTGGLNATSFAEPEVLACIGAARFSRLVHSN